MRTITITKTWVSVETIEVAEDATQEQIEQAMAGVANDNKTWDSTIATDEDDNTLAEAY